MGLHRHLNHMREKAKAISDRMAIKQVATRASDLIDCASFGMKAYVKRADGGGKNTLSSKDVTQADESVLSCLFYEGMDRAYVAKATRRRDPDIDLGFDFVVFPQKRSLLGLAFTEHREHRNLLAANGWEEYPYWDNTDPPEDMRDGKGYRKWEARGLEWAKAMGFGNPDAWLAPSEVGLTISLVNEGYFPLLGHEEAGKVARATPSKKKRAKSIAIETLYGEIAPKAKITTESAAMRLLRKIRDSKALEIRTSKVQERMLDITPELLKTKMKDIPVV